MTKSKYVYRNDEGKVIIHIPKEERKGISDDMLAYPQSSKEHKKFIKDIISTYPKNLEIK